jgi:excisionase family DNA binding protein
MNVSTFIQNYTEAFGEHAPLPLLFFYSDTPLADTEKIIRKKYDVPIWHKSNLTIDEAVEYSGIGRERLRKLTSQEECPFVLHIGNRRMIKRRIFDEYIEKLTFLE